MNKEEINYSLYKAAEHLSEAAKHISFLSKDKAAEFMTEANAMLDAIVPVVDKVSDEKLNDIMNEIINFGGETNDK